MPAEVRRLLALRARAANDGRRAAEDRLREINGEIERLVDAVAAVGISAALQQCLQAAEAEREALQRQHQAAAPSAPVRSVPAVLARYRGQLLDLQCVLTVDVAPSDLARTAS